MASATTLRSTLSDEELQKLVTLTKDVDSIELKVTVPERAQLFAIRALGLDPLQAQLRQVFFFDTPDLALDRAGVVVRGRRSQKKGDDSVVKLRPVVPSEMPETLRRSPNFGIELDASPQGFVVSGSCKGVPVEGSVLEAVSGRKKLRKLFSKEQQALYAEHAPEGVALDDLTVLGPLFCMKLKGTPEGFDRRLVTEMWFYPDGSRILEFSTKCAPSEAFQVAAETRAFLGSKDIDLAGEQQMKTRTALEYFAKTFKKGSGKATTGANKTGAKRAKSTAGKNSAKAAAKPAAD
jgi:hypothetical protein